MSKYLYVARHGEAAHGPDDHERPLTPHGEQEARQTGAWLRSQGIRPDAIASSTAIRARETARIIAEATGFEVKRILTTRRIYDADLLYILDLIFGYEDLFSHVLLVGHNPTSTMLAQYLAPDAPGHLPTAGLIGIRFAVDRWIDASAGTGQTQYFFYPSLNASQA